MDGIAACFGELKDPRASNACRDDSHGSELCGDPATPRATEPLWCRSQAGLSHTVSLCFARS